MLKFQDFHNLFQKIWSNIDLNKNSYAGDFRTIINSNTLIVQFNSVVFPRLSQRIVLCLFIAALQTPLLTESFQQLFFNWWTVQVKSNISGSACFLSIYFQQKMAHEVNKFVLQMICKILCRFDSGYTIFCVLIYSW